MVEEEICLYASHRQFYVQDSEPAGTSDGPDFWTQQASADRLAVADGLLGIGTGSHDFVRVQVQEHVRVHRLPGWLGVGQGVAKRLRVWRGPSAAGRPGPSCPGINQALPLTGPPVAERGRSSKKWAES
jgi:hypothetical protein